MDIHVYRAPSRFSGKAEHFTITLVTHRHLDTQAQITDKHTLKRTLALTVDKDTDDTHSALTNSTTFRTSCI